MTAMAAFLLAAALSAGAPDPRDNGASTLDVSSFPADEQGRYELFSKRCVRCHSLARSINADFDAGEWKRYVRKMIRRPDSGINEEEGEQIFRFLKFYAERKKK